MAKIYIPLDSIHLFRKKNGVTLFDDVGQYDLMKCSECEIEGKCRDCVNVEIPRNSKKAKYCTIKQKDVKKIEAESKYKSGIITKHECPKCKTPLSEIALYTEEDTDNYLAEVICKCGHKDLIDVTKREKAKEKIKKKPKFTMDFTKRKSNGQRS